MPKKVRGLSALEVKRLRHTGRGGNATFAVGGVSGLYLQLAPTGARSWILRSKVGERRRHIGLGGFPDVTLAQAREKAREAKQQIANGEDPIEDRKARKAALFAEQQRGITFRDAKEKFLVGKLAEFDNPKHRKQWRATLDTYADPGLGNMLVSEISVADIQRTLEPIWIGKNETASRLRGRIEAVLAWATVAGHRQGDNPARWKGNLDAVLPKSSRIAKVKHHPALALDDATEWFAAIKQREGMATRALEFKAMTLARSGEVRGATWDEISFKDRVWIVPAQRMKGRAEHRVPLTENAIDLLKSLDRFAGGNFIFPAPRGGKLSDAALSACMKRVNHARIGGFLDSRSGKAAVPHGLRSTFRDWCGERTDFPRDMAEIALAHNVGSEVERAYRRGDMLEKRRKMMSAWEDFLHGGEAPNVLFLAAS